MLNYLRITKLRVGLILNFKNARLEWERIVHPWLNSENQRGRVSLERRRLKTRLKAEF